MPATLRATWVQGTVLSSYEVRVTGHFEDDLDAALEWRLREVGRSSALRLYNAYLSKIAPLETFPLMGGRVEDFPYRWTAIERYVAVYAVDEEARTVTLLRLFHMSSDWRARLLAESSSY